MTEMVGQNLKGRYFLRDFAGSGGMAHVYQAWDNVRGTKMAVKILHPEMYHNERFRAMFEQEAELLRTLSHPSIVRIFDVDVDDQNRLAFIVMEWIDGGNLRERIGKERRPFLISEAQHILSSMCTALNFTHLNRVYHCDVKPANV